MTNSVKNMRLQALKAFKSLHRTRQIVFNEDLEALEKARSQINSEFKMNKHISNPESIGALIKLAEDVDKELRLSVVQVAEKEPGKYELKLRPENTRLDNVPYNDCPNTKKA